MTPSKQKMFDDFAGGGSVGATVEEKIKQIVSPLQERDDELISQLETVADTLAAIMVAMTKLDQRMAAIESSLEKKALPPVFPATPPPVRNLKGRLTSAASPPCLQFNAVAFAALRPEVIKHIREMYPDYRYNPNTDTHEFWP